MNQTELVMRRRNVAAFIKADPVNVSFTRLPEPTRTAAGGLVASGAATLPAQQARIVLNKRRYTAGLVNAEAGEIPHTDYLLIAVHTTDIKEDDSFMWLGENYRVVGIYKARQESILASIDLLGQVNKSAS